MKVSVIMIHMHALIENKLSIASALLIVGLLTAKGYVVQTANADVQPASTVAETQTDSSVSTSVSTQTEHSAVSISTATGATGQHSIVNAGTGDDKSVAKDTKGPAATASTVKSSVHITAGEVGEDSGSQEIDD